MILAPFLSEKYWCRRWFFRYSPQNDAKSFYDKRNCKI